MTDQTTPIEDRSVIDLAGEALDMRGKIREAADNGDIAEVRRLAYRIRDLEVETFARRYTDIRHARAQRGRGGGPNPQLEQIEGQLSQMLARLGIPSHLPTWR